ncbi:MAG: hypothetical protein JAZ17_19475, partial [Candidatus Thiodiazotropha endolucinida]|nr:hypothetical protein [Candidatus Thiodiazotropha endolucinida]
QYYKTCVMVQCLVMSIITIQPQVHTIGQPYKEHTEGKRLERLLVLNILQIMMALRIVIAGYQKVRVYQKTA